MSNRKAERLAQAIVGTVVVGVTSLVIISVATNHIGLELGDVAIVGLALLPLVAALGFSGLLTELTGPGGISIKLQAVAEQPVELSTMTVMDSILPSHIVEKGRIDELEGWLRTSNVVSPFLLALEFAPASHYKLATLQKYIAILAKYHSFKFVVLYLHPTGTFAACIPVTAMYEILNQPQLGSRFVEDVNSGQIVPTLSLPGVVTTAVSPETTNIEALKMMTKLNLDSLIVVDDMKRLLGIVERDQILSKLMLAIAGE